MDHFAKLSILAESSILDVERVPNSALLKGVFLLKTANVESTHRGLVFTVYMTVE